MYIPNKKKEKIGIITQNSFWNNLFYLVIHLFMIVII